jgi:hypothetical protein
MRNSNDGGFVLRVIVDVLGNGVLFEKKLQTLESQRNLKPNKFRATVERGLAVPGLA